MTDSTQAPEKGSFGSDRCVNVRPPDAKSHECRFYNAEFSIGSSIISFVIPCILVLFVYIRILITLKKREKAARLRRMKNFQPGASSKTQTTSSDDFEETGHAVTEPVINVVMMALPMITQDMRRFDQQRGTSSIPDENVMSPRSSADTLFDIDNVVTNDFTSHGDVDSSLWSFSKTPKETSLPKKEQKKSNAILPAILRQLSGRKATLVVKSTPENRGHKEVLQMILGNPSLDPKEHPKSDSEVQPVVPSPDCTRTSVESTSKVNLSPLVLNNGNNGCITVTTLSSQVTSPTEFQNTVKFATVVQEMSEVKPREFVSEQAVESSFKAAGENHSNTTNIFSTTSLPETETEIAQKRLRSLSLKSANSSQNLLKSVTNGIASKITKRNLKHEQSFKRKASKSQRKEKRATKTLGVVVGVFLICWVPFFFINIVNAVCVLLNKEFCQVGFDLFFYSTWIGYMNSFMNPIIYTIFNTEFRRAFRAILFGKSGYCRCFYKHAGV
ncbi:hypothetical protein KIN20_018996 [Parelaphostrongylus tenuis]|uniref:G-protein coupled receptors family 1 profile domain-containing protein n=1 Tax=Parelaphostrongylus tenuis TaxID=148309 RepID=A0AAD5QRZ9_PARTN|nr:hypothetical protein KIN20_018996 [Parelaphostrongylus tenuis]